MRLIIFVIAVLQVESIVGNENEETFTCKRAGLGSVSQVLGGTDDVKLGQSSNNVNEGPSNKQVIRILEERIRVLESESYICYFSLMTEYNIYWCVSSWRHCEPYSS